MIYIKYTYNVSPAIASGICFLSLFFISRTCVEEDVVLVALSSCSCQVDTTEVIASLKARIQQDVAQLIKSSVPKCLICMVSPFLHGGCETFTSQKPVPVNKCSAY